MSDGITAYYLAFDGEAVCVGFLGIRTPSTSNWQHGICDVTIFPTIELANLQLDLICKNKARGWRDRFNIQRIYAPFSEALAAERGEAGGASSEAEKERAGRE